MARKNRVCDKCEASTIMGFALHEYGCEDATCHKCGNIIPEYKRETDKTDFETLSKFISRNYGCIDIRIDESNGDMIITKADNPHADIEDCNDI